MNGRPFVHGFELYLEKATLVYESGTTPLTVIPPQGNPTTPSLPGGDGELTAFTTEIQMAVNAVKEGKAPTLLSGQRPATPWPCATRNASPCASRANRVHLNKWARSARRRGEVVDPAPGERQRILRPEFDRFGRPCGRLGGPVHRLHLFTRQPERMKDKPQFTPMDVAAQKQAMKKPRRRPFLLRLQPARWDCLSRGRLEGEFSPVRFQNPA